MKKDTIIACEEIYKRGEFFASGTINTMCASILDRSATVTESNEGVSYAEPRLFLKQINTLENSDSFSESYYIPYKYGTEEEEMHYTIDGGEDKTIEDNESIIGIKPHAGLIIKCYTGTDYTNTSGEALGLAAPLPWKYLPIGSSLFFNTTGQLTPISDSTVVRAILYKKYTNYIYVYFIKQYKVYREENPIEFQPDPSHLYAYSGINRNYSETVTLDFSEYLPFNVSIMDFDILDTSNYDIYGNFTENIRAENNNHFSLAHINIHKLNLSDATIPTTHLRGELWNALYPTYIMQDIGGNDITTTDGTAYLLNPLKSGFSDALLDPIITHFYNSEFYKPYNGFYIDFLNNEYPNSLCNNGTCLNLIDMNEDGKVYSADTTEQEDYFSFSQNFITEFRSKLSTKRIGSDSILVVPGGSKFLLDTTIGTNIIDGVMIQDPSRDITSWEKFKTLISAIPANCCSRLQYPIFLIGSADHQDATESEFFQMDSMYCMEAFGMLTQSCVIYHGFDYLNDLPRQYILPRRTSDLNYDESQELVDATFGAYTVTMKYGNTYPWGYLVYDNINSVTVSFGGTW